MSFVAFRQISYVFFYKYIFDSANNRFIIVAFETSYRSAVIRDNFSSNADPVQRPSLDWTYSEELYLNDPCQKLRS